MSSTPRTPDAHDNDDHHEHLPVDASSETPSNDGESLTDYVDFLASIPADNAIAKRFVSAAHLLARGVLVNTVFTFIRGLEFSWEESVEMTGDVLHMSRSTVARSVRDVDRIIDFWNANGYHVSDLEEVVSQISDLTKERLAKALDEKADED